MRFAKGGMLACVATVAAVTLAVLSVPGLAQAQSKAVRAHVPFGFYAGGAELPAGSYTLRMRGDSVQISDGNGHAAAVRCNRTQNRDVNLESRLVFNIYGETRFLSEVRWQGYSSARKLIQTSAELEIAKTIQVHHVVASITR